MSFKSIPLKFNFQTFLFLLTIFFIPQQFGPHFWPEFSMVHGIRVDYLSPSFYISDVLIIILFLTSYKKVFAHPLTKSFLSHKLFLISVLIIFFPLFYATQQLALLYKTLKLIEVLFLGLFTATMVSKKNVLPALWVFSAAAFLEALLGISEFIKQGSINGLFYFFGERYFTPSTLGQAVINTSHGLLVRPYATFPHPNVLAFFLFMGAVFSSYVSHHEKNNTRKYLALFLFAVIEVCLFLTFSRIILICNILFLLYSFLLLPIFQNRNNIKRIIGFSLLVILLAFFFVSYSNRFFSFSSFFKDSSPRIDLAIISTKIISSQPLFGVGLNNFFYHEARYQTGFSSTRLQPVHNIFLLIGTEAGILGLFVFVYFSVKTVSVLYKKVKNNSGSYSFAEMVFILFTAFIFAGLFDHFFFTTQQGLFMMALLFGFSFSKTS